MSSSAGWDTPAGDPLADLIAARQAVEAEEWPYAGEVIDVDEVTVLEPLDEEATDAGT